MNQIGASHITLADFFIVGGAVLLYVKLSNLPANSPMCRIVAWLCSGVVVTIILVFFLTDNLSGGGVGELGVIGLWMCVGLGKWHARARASRRTLPTSETAS